MVANTAEISAISQSFATNLLTFSAKKGFDAVVSDFEKELGHLDQAKALSTLDKVSDVVKRMEGPSGLMIIAVLEMDRLLPEFSSFGIKSRQYLVGNPLIADQMAKFDTLATLFAPPRVLIFTRNDETCVTYEQPSTTFGRLNSEQILQIARDLDQKFERLARIALN